MPEWITKNVLFDAELKQLVDKCREAKVCAFDLETASEAPVKKPGLHEWHTTSRVVSASFTFDTEPNVGYCIPLSHPEGPYGSQWVTVLTRIAKALHEGQTRLVGHHAKYDLKWIKRHTRIDLGDLLFWDTENSSHLLNENMTTKLKVRGAAMMGGNWGIDVATPETVPWFDLAVYNAGDTVATYRLYRSHLKSLKSEQNEGLKQVFTKITTPATRAIMRVEEHGMKLDMDRTREALRVATEEANDAEMELMSMALSWGMEPDKFKTISWEATALWFLAFMEEAVSRDLIPVVEVTSKGRPSWRKGVLNKIAMDYPDAVIPKLMLSYRHGAKQAQFLQSWIDHADTDALVHPTFRMSTTVTGRTSSANPNAQQISRELKPCWHAPTGWKFVEADYSQIEMRVAAEFLYRLLGDNPMMQAYLDGLDLHTEIAALVAGIDAKDVTKDQRQSGKAVNFGFLFGMGAKKFVTYALETYGVAFTLPEAEEVRRLYFKRWAGLQEFHDNQRSLAARFGYVENLYGRIRHLPQMFTGDDWERGAAERMAINSPVQSSASDTMLRAIACIDKRCDRDKLRIVGTVHDSVLLWVRENEAHPTKELGKACDLMLNPLLDNLGVKLTVPIEVEAEVGEHWGEAQETYIFSTAS